MTQQKNVQVSASVPADQAAALENVFFEAKGGYKRKNDVLRHAVTFFLENLEQAQHVDDAPKDNAPKDDTPKDKKDTAKK